MKAIKPIKARAKREESVLYVRGLKASNIKWLRNDSKEKNMSTGEYLDEVIAQLREYGGKQTKRKASSSRAKRK